MVNVPTCRLSIALYFYSMHNTRKIQVSPQTAVLEAYSTTICSRLVVYATHSNWVPSISSICFYWESYIFVVVVSFPAVYLFFYHTW